ncbi:MAG TPA: lysylphosphatidylglycerol synthase domain-containing protein [Vicinamibacterales bacterium]|nr:lysylphosphatidylglycerol synthase domain-containing protein [Vicinamibacterales bacterium]
MSRRGAQIVSRVALGLGVALFAGTLWHVDLDALTGMAGRLGTALPIVLVLSGIWHLARTWSWAACFAEPLPLPFGSLARVRLAAEAFSYVTVRGVAGEPLKVMMLTGRIDSRRATAAVALERVSYLVITTGIVGVCAAAAAASMPLSAGWFRVYSGFAIVAAVIVGASVLLARGRGAYLKATLDLLHRASRGRLRGGGVARFLTATEHHIVELVKGHPHRLARLVLANLICFVAMALEVWVVSRAMGVSLTTSGAIAVETFSRVASFASAFVPAGIGTSEASNVAGMAAVGVPGAGLALAAARRFRGLFWAGVGFLVYPKRLAARPPLDLESANMHTLQSQAAGTADIGSRFSGHVLIYMADDPRVPVSPLDRLAALPIGERVLRAADRAGYDDILVWAPTSHAGLSRVAARLALRSRVAIARDSASWRKLQAGLRVPALTVIGSGTVVAPSLLEAARHALPAPEPGYGIDIPAGDRFPQSGVLRVHADDAADPAGLADIVHDRWRAGVSRPDGQDVSAHRAMLALRIADSGQDLARAEAEIRRSVYKSTDPYLARVNRRMSLPISMLLLRTPMTANALSLLLVFLGFTSGWLFSLGSYATGVAAAALSLGASILDGCDGEIARLKYQESAFGCWVETIGDYTYYIAIFVGLTVGAVRYTANPIFYRIGAVALAGTFITFALLIWLRRRITNGQPEKLQSTAKAHFYASKKRWAWLVAKLSFCATRSTMPYGIMAFALLGILPGILVLAAIGANVYWVSLTIRLPWLLAPAQPKTAARAVGDAA